MPPPLIFASQILSHFWRWRKTSANIFPDILKKISRLRIIAIRIIKKYINFHLMKTCKIKRCLLMTACLPHLVSIKIFCMLSTSMNNIFIPIFLCVKKYFVSLLVFLGWIVFLNLHVVWILVILFHLRDIVETVKIKKIT